MFQNFPSSLSKSTYLRFSLSILLCDLLIKWHSFCLQRVDLVTFGLNWIISFNLERTIYSKKDYDLFTWSNPSRLHDCKWIIFSTKSSLFLYYFWVNLLYSCSLPLGLNMVHSTTFFSDIINMDYILLFNHARVIMFKFPFVCHRKYIAIFNLKFLHFFHIPVDF